jgi:hypothetical protein
MGLYNLLRLKIKHILRFYMEIVEISDKKKKILNFLTNLDIVEHSE